jgi:hypothetical protein
MGEIADYYSWGGGAPEPDQIDLSKYDIRNLKREWTTKEGKTLQIEDMETSHIQNCIRMIERKWDELEEETDYFTAEHWSIPDVLVTYGKDHYGEKLKMFEEELKSRTHNKD